MTAQAEGAKETEVRARVSGILVKRLYEEGGSDTKISKLKEEFHTMESVRVFNGVLLTIFCAALIGVGLAIIAGKIATIGNLSAARGALELDAKGQAVAPGFINMLSSPATGITCMLVIMGVDELLI